MITNFLGKGVFLAASTACCSWHPRLIRTKLLVTLEVCQEHHITLITSEIISFTCISWKLLLLTERRGIIWLKNLFIDCFPWGWTPDVGALHDHELKAKQSNQKPQDKQLTSFLPIHTLKLFKAESTLPPYFTAFRCPLVKANSFSRHHLVPCFCSFFDYVQLFFQQEIFAL